MDITLYNMYEDKRNLLKSPLNGITLSCDFYDSSNIIAPKLLIEFNTAVFQKNYCYIPTFSRYYFINNIEVDAGERIIINCSIDVLNTYKSNILSLDVTVTRNEYAQANNLIDPLATFTPKRNVEVYPFSSTPFNIRSASATNNYVLVVGGGYGS